VRSLVHSASHGVVSSVSSSSEVGSTLFVGLEGTAPADVGHSTGVSSTLGKVSRSASHGGHLAGMGSSHLSELVHGGSVTSESSSSSDLSHSSNMSSVSSGVESVEVVHPLSVSMSGFDVSNSGD